MTDFQNTTSEKPLISVIIPFSNQAEFLEECLRSVMTQTYENLEIILVDDGSTDGSSEIVKRFSAKDKRIKYVWQKHAGVATARNTGLKHVRGEYLMFVDSDDWVEPEIVKFHYDLLVDNDVDIVTTTYRVREDYNNVLNTNDALIELFLGHNYTFCPWAKLYKTELWHGVQFPDGHLHEDEAVMVKVFMKAKSVYSSGKRYYHYRNNPHSIVSNATTERYADYIHFARKNIELVEEYHPSIVPFAESYLWKAGIKAITYTGKFHKEYRQIMRQYWRSMLQTNRLSGRERFFTYLSVISPWLAGGMSRLGYKIKGRNTNEYRT